MNHDLLLNSAGFQAVFLSVCINLEVPSGSHDGLTLMGLDSLWPDLLLFFLMFQGWTDSSAVAGAEITRLDLHLLGLKTSFYVKFTFILQVFLSK